MSFQLIRRPKLSLQAGIYTRITTEIPTLTLYAVPPRTKVSFPFAEFGLYSGRPDPEWKAGKHWSCLYAIGFWSQADTTAEIDTLMDSAVSALTKTQIPLVDNWEIYDVTIEADDVFDIIMDEFGPLIHGTLAVRFGIEDIL